MPSFKKQYEKPISDPAPCSASNEDIRKAQALREALRRKLLDHAGQKSDPYWTVGAD
jgi:hypothetical protein